MQSFSFIAPGKIISESGASATVGEHVRAVNASRVVVITDPGILAANLIDELLMSLRVNQIDSLVLSDVQADPSELLVLDMLAKSLRFQPDLILGIGGGSSMDVAKVLAVLAAPDCDTSINNIYGIDLISGQRLPLILIPTTAGTGSEVTPIAIITTGETSKKGIVSAKLLPDVAILDATLTTGLPADVTAATGIDAMVHAIEAYTSKLKKNLLSDMYAIKALSLLCGNIKQAVFDGNNLEVRQNMLLGAMFAGQAFANAPVAAVHALAYPLGGHFHIPHGLSNALVLVEVMKFNLPKCADRYAELYPVVTGEETRGHCATELSYKLIDWIEGLIIELGLPTQLRQCGVTEQSLEVLAKDAMLQQRLLINNPRELTQQDAYDIYSKVY